MKVQLLKETAWIAIVSCSLGLLTACATSDDIILEEECWDETGAECTMASGNGAVAILPELATENYIVTSTSTVDGNTYQEKTTFIGSKDGTDLALSKPAAEKGVSVKDKQKSTLVIETTQQTQKEPVAVAVGVPTKEVKVEEKKVVETVVEKKKTADPVVVVDKHPSTQTVTKQTTTSVRSTMAEKVAYGERCHDWEAPAGETLRSLLMQWGEESGWTVIWKLERDYNLEAGVVFRGTFTEVSGALIRSFARATPAPIGTFYKGNRVLVVNTQEDENAD